MSERRTFASPRIEDRAAIRVFGIGKIFTMANMGEIPVLWQKFGDLIGTISGEVPGNAYGVNYVGSESKDEFGYLAGVEVSADAVVPDRMVEFLIPAQRYAVFAHDGHVSQLTTTIHSIFSEWETIAPGQMFEPKVGGVSFIEQYGARFDPATGSGDITVWFPIRS